MADGRVERGNQTRRTVLERTMSTASMDGLEGLSLGKIATELGLSKSGVFALFGSKEELQLATVQAARDVFVEEVVRPVRDEPAGIAKVWRLCESWLDYSGRRVFPGGCFFYSAAAEFDSRPGPVHDEIAKTRGAWTRYVERLLDEARLADGFRDAAAADAEAVEQLAFEIMAMMELANAHSVLHEDTTAYDRAARGILARLRAATAAPEELPERPPVLTFPVAGFSAGDAPAVSLPAASASSDR
ncbi:TetR/AcrR family transcriptional regulator [Streptomyces sp. NPDC002812]|uniref:TetR/AcrR family transcriptional regulator n=1 Tax=unclassified Streptomyces TaxID=2593676 RepID=UPI0020302252|nr:MULTISPECIES: TetR/AcrR family transcriptional regulator [unclassified Streptomyces]MCM1967258.1 TetR/AcrR family transcriptional regulator [Streptomyces sp. G1]MCX5127871.1 TetR/AcrR family transcriptional regulator [Streptomyces sp. NBC_00347]MCX5301463.1 TetR/AcrR family transcriptional regulator [Streptomyces sp. NBC_00193]